MCIDTKMQRSMMGDTDLLRAAVVTGSHAQV